MPNTPVPASAIALPITRRFLVCSLLSLPVIGAPTLRTVGFDAAAYIRTMKAAGLDLHPCHALRSFFIGATGGQQFQVTWLEQAGAAEQVYAALCAEEVTHG